MNSQNQNPLDLTRPMTLADCPDSVLEQILSRAGRDVFVVMNKSGTTVLQDPVDPNMPWSNRNRKMAELVAKENGGVVMTLQDATKRLISVANSKK